MQETLTSEEISALDRCIDEFQVANYEVQERIVKQFLLSFKDDLTEEEFNALAMQTVCAQFTELGCSQIFLAYLPAPLQKNKNQRQGTLLQKPAIGWPKKGAHAIYFLSAVIKREV